MNVRSSFISWHELKIKWKIKWKKKVSKNIIDKERSWRWQERIKLKAQWEMVSLGRKDYSSGLWQAKRGVVKTQICPSVGRGCQIVRQKLKLHESERFRSRALRIRINKDKKRTL